MNECQRDSVFSQILYESNGGRQGRVKKSYEKLKEVEAVVLDEVITECLTSEGYASDEWLVKMYQICLNAWQVRVY